MIAFVIAATAFVNLEPPLSMATRLSNPAKMIAGFIGPVQKVTVNFAVTSTLLDDLNILLIGQDGTKTLIISDGVATEV